MLVRTHPLQQNTRRFVSRILRHELPPESLRQHRRRQLLDLTHCIVVTTLKTLGEAKQFVDPTHQFVLLLDRRKRNRKCLKGRKIADLNPGVDWDDRTCHVNERTSAVSVSVDELTADTASVVERLAAPVLMLFDGLELSRKWILREVPSFRSL